jgi:hypothetical protein
MFRAKTVQGISWKCCRLLHAPDGYSYNITPLMSFITNVVALGAGILAISLIFLAAGVNPGMNAAILNLSPYAILLLILLVLLLEIILRARA